MVFKPKSALSDNLGAPGGLLARAVNMLEEVGMSYTEFTVEQCEAILTSLRRLEMMNMGDDWDEIDGELVARARLVIGKLYTSVM